MLRACRTPSPLPGLLSRTVGLAPSMWPPNSEPHPLHSVWSSLMGFSPSAFKKEIYLLSCIGS